MMTLKTIADTIMLQGMKENDILKDWEYRKGKDITDIKRAKQKALRYAGFKVEEELAWFAIFLKDVLKKRRKPCVEENTTVSNRQ